MLDHTVRLPADKSIAHRALIMNAMAHGLATVRIHRPGEDVLSTIAALESLGAAERDRELVRITGGGTPERAALPGSDDARLDCGNAGTLMRLLIGAATTRDARTTLTGDASLSSRPMERVAGPLRLAGAKVTTTEGHAPVVVEGAAVQSTRHELPVASAQVLGSILLAALAADGETVVTVPGPTRDHTERMLAWFGVDVVRDGLTTRLRGPAGFAARDVDVPGDISGAAFWMVAGAIVPGATVTLPHVGLNPTRLGVVRVLERMGADIQITPGVVEGPEPAGDIVVRGSGRLRAVDLGDEDVADVIDELPILAVAMAAAEGVSRVSDAQELRVKESDRIALTVEGLRAMGVDATETEDGWVVTGAPPRPAASGTTDAHAAADARSRDAALIRTDGDHRIAMAFAIADLAGIGTRGAEPDDRACAAISYPGFWEDFPA